MELRGLASALALAWGLTAFAQGPKGTWTLALEPLPRGETVRVTGEDYNVDHVTLPDGTELPIRITGTTTTTADETRLRLDFANDSKDWRIAGFCTAPFTTRTVSAGKTDIYMPVGLGKRTPYTKPFETPTYPGNTMTMPFLILGDATRSVYIGHHDRTAANGVRFDFALDEQTGEGAFRATLPLSVHPGERRDAGEIVFKEFDSDWHAGARFYRAFYDTCRTMARPEPAWPQDMSGWLLVIMKQQNESNFWNYADIGKGISDYADRLGLDTIGLFGWTKGGHDHLYPDYDPCERMGGAAGLKAGIAAAKARGKRVIIYANGQLQQVGATEFWKTDGERLALEHKDGTFVTHHYHKYSDIPKYDFRLGCLHGKAWYERMLFLAEQANGFGADGILYDQFGIGCPFLCWGQDHGHPVPAYSYGDERVGFITHIRDAVRAKNPEFTVSTEGIHDSIFSTIDFFHGYARGVFGSGAAKMALRFARKDDGTFPELVRYTFPELVMTSRVPVPIVSHGMVNYTLLFGLRHDVEVRYGPDRTFIETGRTMTREDYGTVCDVPSLKLINLAPLDEQAVYLKAANDFRKANADLLLHGRFVDEDGFTLEGKGVLAKRYVGADGTSGVLVWNVSKEPQAVAVKGLGKPVAVSEIGNAAVDAATPLAPDTLRLYRFAKPPTAPVWRLTAVGLGADTNDYAFASADCAAPQVIRGEEETRYVYENVGGRPLSVAVIQQGQAMRVAVSNSVEGLCVSSIWVKHGEPVPLDLENGYAVTSIGGGSLMKLQPLAKVTGSGEKVAGWTWKDEYAGYYRTLTSIMNWAAFCGPTGGVYYAHENPKYDVADLFGIYDPASRSVRFGVKHYFYCHPGEAHVTSPVVTRRFSGDWHAAADLYRDWFLANRKVAHHPDWLRNSTGWMLTILKQQNGEIMWPYESIGKEMTDQAKARGFDILGIFGRGPGGHDRYYPDYSPDPELGGEAAFKKGIAEAKARGMRVILYTNGQLIDKDGTDFWPTLGSDIAICNRQGERYGESFQKYYNAPKRNFGWACLRDPRWRDLLLKFAKEAHALGADGILYDQLGRQRTDRTCWNPNHGHKVPEYAFGVDVVETLEWVQNEMHRIDPDFVVCTEGFSDVEMVGCAFTHRLPRGQGAVQDIYENMALGRGTVVPAPQVLAYTLPTHMCTASAPAPLAPRWMLNYDTLIRDMAEIEVRYQPDVDLLKTDANQSREKYKDVKMPGSGPYTFEMVERQDPKAMRIYAQQVHAFQQKFGRLLRTGRFVDDRHFTLEKPDGAMVLAKSFLSEDSRELGVVVWNVSTSNATAYAVKPDAGWRPVGVYAPDREVDATAPLPPESIAFHVFARDLQVIRSEREYVGEPFTPNMETGFVLSGTGLGKRTPLSAFPKGWTKLEDGRTYRKALTSQMKWGCVADGADGGVYAAIEDTRREIANLYVDYVPEEKTMRIGVNHRFAADADATVPPPKVTVRRYTGDWHKAADMYRDWFTSAYRLARQPEWLRNSTGWMLTILKQQNGEIMWPYETIGKEMTDQAQARGLDILGLFGRGPGGHDRFYPDYTPDPALGGEAAFRKGIAEAKARGMHVILYINGQLIDKDGTDYWPTLGKDIAIRNQQGDPYGESFQKYYNAPNRNFGWACLRDPRWEETLFNIAKMANDLGADGVLYDQLGVQYGRACWNAAHGHKVPELCYAEDMPALLDRIHERMGKINPDFVIATEGFIDVELSALAFNHRGVLIRPISQKAVELIAADAADRVFPEMLTYTFPMRKSTSSNAAPLNTRRLVNYNTVFGEMDEIEVRYAPDVDLVKTDRNQTREAYKDVKMPGSGPHTFAMVEGQDPKAMRLYTKAVHDFQKAHAELLRRGRFTDTHGFTLETASNTLIAKSYLSEDGTKLGVIVWNVSPKENAAFAVKPEAGWKPAGAFAPEGDATGELKPESIALYVFAR